MSCDVPIKAIFTTNFYAYNTKFSGDTPVNSIGENPSPQLPLRTKTICPKKLRYVPVKHTLQYLNSFSSRSIIDFVNIFNIFCRNALSLAMLDELKQHLIDSSVSKDVRVIILGHSGPVFSAGHDLKELVMSWLV